MNTNKAKAPSNAPGEKSQLADNRLRHEYAEPKPSAIIHIARDDQGNVEVVYANRRALP